MILQWKAGYTMYECRKERAHALIDDEHRNHQRRGNLHKQDLYAILTTYPSLFTVLLYLYLTLCHRVPQTSRWKMNIVSISSIALHVFRNTWLQVISVRQSGTISTDPLPAKRLFVFDGSKAILALRHHLELTFVNLKVRLNLDHLQNWSQSSFPQKRPSSLWIHLNSKLSGAADDKWLQTGQLSLSAVVIHQWESLRDD